MLGRTAHKTRVTSSILSEIDRDSEFSIALETRLKCQAIKAAENLALLRNPTLNFLRHGQTIKDSTRGKCIHAMLHGRALETLLRIDILTWKGKLNREWTRFQNDLWKFPLSPSGAKAEQA